MSIPYANDVNYIFTVGPYLQVNIEVPATSPNTAVFASRGNFYVAAGVGSPATIPVPPHSPPDSITYANATVSFSSPIDGYYPTRLVNGITYTATITVDGGAAQPLTIGPIISEHFSFNDLVNALNLQVTGGQFLVEPAFGTLDFTDNNPTPQTGTVVLTAGTLFPTLAGYVSITNTNGSIATGPILNPQRLVLTGTGVTDLSFLGVGDALISVTFSTSSETD